MQVWSKRSCFTTGSAVPWAPRRDHPGQVSTQSSSCGRSQQLLPLLQKQLCSNPLLFVLHCLRKKSFVAFVLEQVRKSLFHIRINKNFEDLWKISLLVTPRRSVTSWGDHTEGISHRDSQSNSGQRLKCWFQQQWVVWLLGCPGKGLSVCHVLLDIFSDQEERSCSSAAVLKWCSALLQWTQVCTRNQVAAKSGGIERADNHRVGGWPHFRVFLS